MIKCTKCNYQTEENINYCPNCGSPLGEIKTSNNSNPNIQHAKIKPIYAGIAGLIIFVLCIVGSQQGNKSSISPSGKSTPGPGVESTPSSTVEPYTGGSTTSPSGASDTRSLCVSCHGTGMCPVCDGTGTYRNYGESSPCSACGGTGVCSICDGTGYN